MRAARLHAYREPFRIDEVPVPEPGPGEVRIRVAAAGACHSDLHIWHGDSPEYMPLPRILGHENAGHVDALGPGASGVEPGEPVAVYGGWGCGACRFCLTGAEQLCDTGRWGGLGPPGGYAEYMVVPGVRHLVGIGELDPVRAAPLTDAALTPYHAIRMVRARLHPGSAALLIGAGGLGQMAIQLTRLLTPARVIVADTSESKRRLALELGADAVVDPVQGDAVAEVRARAGGEGAAAVIDLVGTDESLALAGACLARRAALVLVGLGGGTLPFAFHALPGEATVTSSCWGTRGELAEVVALAREGRLRMTVESAPVDQINEVFERLERGAVDGRAVLVPAS